MKRDILVPFDGSKNAVEALRVAMNLAKALHEKVIVLNVQPEFKTPNVKRFFSEQDVREYQRQLFREAIGSTEQELNDAGVDYEIRLKVGDPKEVIVKQAYPFAAEQPGCGAAGIRMIIMGSRGMNPLLGGVLGSVSYGVVNAAPCPVTIVPYACD
jgi:nucleotide-binding universal stress UspA family protein